MISLTIDGKKVTVEEGTTVLQAARKVGADIPTLCHHPELKPNAACRICSVEVTQGGRTRLSASCALPAAEGMEVQTATERVLKGRKIIMELLAARCSEVPQIQELAAKVGARTDRLPKKKEECILCGLCVGVCSQIVGQRVIGFKGRGISREVVTSFGGFKLECIGCGACTYVCPTGVLKMEQETLARDKKEGGKRYCRYMRMGMIPYAECPSAFECYHCEVDQRMEDTLGTHPAFVARPAKQTDPVEVNGVEVMPERYYHANHTWVEEVGGYLRLGLDDFARGVAGPIKDVALLKERGAEVKAGEPIWRLSLATEKTVTMLSPVSGTVATVNEDILLDPSLLRKDPYGRGWVCLVRSANAEQELATLRFKDPAVPFYLRAATDPVDAWVNEESVRLRKMLQEQGADIPADGRIRVNLAEVIPDAEWQKLTQAFFGAQ
jgi:glycine cleavage system H lipoate-binding protein/formate hydrogenlyase subunit 6/NADH:ubiquinone oxidoreductase subunit I/ferredoxin